MSIHNLTLSHFSDQRVVAVESLGAPEPHRHKPIGFWVSVDGPDDWEEWCVSERFRLHRLAIRHRVTLSPRANILHLSNAAELDGFSRQYGCKSLWGCNAINWSAVQKKYDGIIIAPYVWESRLDLGWYYSWDCASGCIWYPPAIASVEIITDFLSEAA